MAETPEQKGSYGKRPIWQWIVLYAVVGVIIYGAFYYFVLAKKGGYNSTTTNYNTTQTQTNTTVQPTSKNNIVISNFSFSPATLTVKAGSTVTWTNQDSMGHSATADDNSFDTGILYNGKSGTVTFNKTGTYTYHCSIHPSMHGTIVVN